MTTCILIKKNTNVHPRPGLLKLLRYCCLKMVWHYTQLMYLEVDTEELYKIIPSPLSLESQHQKRLNTDLRSCPSLKFHLFSSQTKERKMTFSLSYLCYCCNQETSICDLRYGLNEMHFPSPCNC